MVHTSSTLILATLVLGAVSILGNPEPKGGVAKTAINAAAHVGAAYFNGHQRREPMPCPRTGGKCPREFQELEARRRSGRRQSYARSPAEKRSIPETDEIFAREPKGGVAKTAINAAAHVGAAYFNRREPLPCPGKKCPREFQELEARRRSGRRNSYARSPAEKRSMPETDEIFAREPKGGVAKTAINAAAHVGAAYFNRREPMPCRGRKCPREFQEIEARRRSGRRKSYARPEERSIPELEEIFERDLEIEELD